MSMSCLWSGILAERLQSVPKHIAKRAGAIRGQELAVWLQPLPEHSPTE
jgi:hypothetical protein